MTYIVSSQSSLSFFNLISYSLFFSSFCYISLYCRITILNIVFLYRCCHILIITRWVPIQRCLEGTLHACILHTLKLRISPILFKMTFPLSIFSTLPCLSFSSFFSLFFLFSLSLQLSLQGKVCLSAIGHSVLPSISTRDKGNKTGRKRHG